MKSRPILKIIFNSILLLALTLSTSGTPPALALRDRASFAAVPTLAACSTLAFGAPMQFGVGTIPLAIAASDLNGDGILDLVTANSNDNTISVLLGNGSGSFSAAMSFAVGMSPDAVAVSDFNGDGKPDVAIPDYASNDISILLGNGDGTFNPPSTYAVGNNPRSVAVGDFNSDGISDLATANSSGTVSILLGNGTGNFNAAVNFAAGGSLRSVAVGDFNGDGALDLAVTDANFNRVSILLGNGIGSFSAPTNITVGTTPNSIVVGDFNSDGKLDLATANTNSFNVSILLGNGTGTFSIATNYAVGGSLPSSIAVSDFNGDGIHDLAVRKLGSNPISILLGNAAGSFSAAMNFTAGLIPFSVAVGDFDGDGKPDLATTDTATVSILLNTCDAVAPMVVSTSLLASYTRVGPAAFMATFSEAVNDPASNTNKDDVTNPNNYLLVNKGANGVANTLSCAGGVVADDTKITVTSVIYNSSIFTSTVTLASALPIGMYRLFICGTTSILDLSGNALAGNGTTSGTDYIFDLAVTAPASSLPKTGFAPNRFTSLAPQPANLTYANMGNIWLEIPSLNVKTNIVGVPQANNTWDVTWLGKDAGWLNGTAFPTWEGNSVITAHVTDSNGLPGPFTRLKDLKYGDKIIVHLSGQQYIFEIRSSSLMRPFATKYAFEHLKDHSYLTLVTCQGYDEQSDSYRFRRIVRAVLVDVR